MQKKNSYRRDIDGLRALAVLGVIFYHSEILIDKILIFSGGFLGVDIFFVISGYLITSIIYKENKVKKFSFINFYIRRIRRLLPALLVVLFASLIFSYFLFLPVEFKSYLDSVISSIFFYSNFYFHYAGQAYGQTILSSKPLLHTWSLAVEEQFYILYPIFLTFSIYLFKKKIKILFYLIILFSLIFASYISENHSSFNFYMLFTRSWELMCGAVIALYHLEEKKRNHYNFLSYIGFFLIIFSFIFFDDPRQHPSFLTLIPVFGCCLIIIDKDSNSSINKFLSHKWFVNIGLISYSLYLWHHPILSFGKISGITEESIFFKILLILLSFFLSALTYHMVEKKFRNSNFISIKKLFIILISAIIFLILFTFYLPSSHKLRYPKILEDIKDQTWFTTKQFFKPCFQRKLVFCSYGNKENEDTIFLVGDSIMASLQEELRLLLEKRNKNFIIMTNAACDFLKIDQRVKIIKKFCNHKIQKQREIKIKKYKNSTIIMSINYKNLDNDNIQLNLFLDNVNKYLKLNYNVILIYPTPQFQNSISSSLYELYHKDKKNFINNISKEANYISLDFEEFRSDVKHIHASFNSLKHKNLYRVFPDSIFCNQIIKDKCLGNSSEHIYFVDTSHLSKKGSNMINVNLIKVIDQIYSNN
jgi:peptidoglycan/LPS O-acetylase OafA/YrhL